MGRRELYERGARQHGVVTPACARAAEVAPSTLRSMARREGWPEPYPHAWVLPGHPVDGAARTAAAAFRELVAAVTADGSESGFEFGVRQDLEAAGYVPDADQLEVVTHRAARRIDIPFRARGATAERTRAATLRPAR